jgi:hypothetical protein
MRSNMFLRPFVDSSAHAIAVAGNRLDSAFCLPTHAVADCQRNDHACMVPETIRVQHPAVPPKPVLPRPQSGVYDTTN